MRSPLNAAVSSVRLTDFLEKVASTHGNSKYALVYRAVVEVAKLQIDLTGEAPEMDEE